MKRNDILPEGVATEMPLNALVPIAETESNGKSTLRLKVVFPRTLLSVTLISKFQNMIMNIKNVAAKDL